MTENTTWFHSFSQKVENCSGAAGLTAADKEKIKVSHLELKCFSNYRLSFIQISVFKAHISVTCKNIIFIMRLNDVFLSNTDM